MENGSASADLLVRPFGSVNAKLLVHDHRGVVNKLRRAHGALATAIKLWDESPKSALRLAQAALSYHDRMCELSFLCSAPTLQPSIKRATIERRRERAAYHRDRGSARVETGRARETNGHLPTWSDDRKRSAR